MDVMMPKMDGLTAVAAIRAHLQPGPLILMLTARGQAHDTPRAWPMAQTATSRSRLPRRSSSNASIRV